MWAPLDVLVSREHETHVCGGREFLVIETGLEPMQRKHFLPIRLGAEADGVQLRGMENNRCRYNEGSDIAHTVGKMRITVPVSGSVPRRECKWSRMSAECSPRFEELPGKPGMAKRGSR